MRAKEFEKKILKDGAVQSDEIITDEMINDPTITVEEHLSLIEKRHVYYENNHNNEIIKLCRDAIKRIDGDESIDNINEGKIAKFFGGTAIIAASLLGSITGAQAEPVQASASEVSGLTQEDIKGFAAALSMDEQRIVDAIENNDVGVMMKILKNVKDSLSGKITVFENAIKEIQSGKWRADLEESLERDMAEMSPEEQAEVKSKLTKENLDKLEESYLVINQGMLKFSLELPKIYDQMLAQYEQHKDKFASVRESVILENSSNQLFDKVRQIIQYGHKIINSPQARLVKKYCRGTPVGQILASVK
jgi:hypothetical protein